MKEIYIVLTHTGTVLSRIIKFYTKKKYSHVSIAIDEKLEKMYSMGRPNAYNPFIGRFVEESIYHGTYKRFKKAKAVIYSMPVTDEQYDGMKKNISVFLEDKDKYKFNVLGLFLTVFNKQRKKENYYYCAEFVKYILNSENIGMDLPVIIKPEHFMKLPNLKLIYEGTLRDFYKDKNEK